MQRITATNWMKTILCFLAFSLSCQICQATIICDNGEYSFQGDICDKNITIDGNVVLYVHGNMDCVTIVCNGSLSLFVEGDFIGDIIAEYLYANIFGGFAGRIDCINGEVDCRAFYGPYPQGDCQIYARDECEYIDDEYGGWGSYGGDEIHIAEEGTATANNYTWTYSLHNGLAEITSISPRPTGALTIPSALDGKTVTSIRGWIFSDCRDLTHVTIPSTVTSIPVSAFNGCTGLTAIEVSAGNSIYESVSGFLLSKDGGTLEFVPGGLTSVEIPGGVTSIGDWSFYSCSYGGLTDVTIPAGIMDIGMYAFYGCNMLKSIIIPSSVTNIKYAAFADCTNACSFVFMGPPPNVASSAFKNVKRGATGTFLTEFKVEWEAVVDENGYWNGLIMHELPPPKITAELADWSSGSITLRCEDADTGVASHKYSLEYLDENNTWVAVGGEGAANVAAAADGFAHLTDGGFCSRLDGIQPVSYRVKDENGRVSEPCVTRNRYGLSVGIGQYAGYDFGLDNNVGFAVDANLCRNLALSQGDFSRFREFLDSDAKVSPVREEMATLAQLAQPGDMVMFFISAHGSEGKIHLYGLTNYSTAQIHKDVEAFNSGVAVIGIIMSCHSGSLLQLGSWPSNAALISSCTAKQISIIFGGGDVIPSPFGGILLQDGWEDGYADRSLFGTSWGGGNGDGIVTFDELARYAAEFSKGYSDMVASSSVQVTNRRLLEHAIAGRAGSGSSFVRPLPPTSCEATHGISDAEIQVTWAQVADPTIRRYWLFRKKPGDAKAACISRYAGSGSFSDARTIEKTTLPKTQGIPISRLAPENFVEYQYHICSVSPCGISNPSPVATGMSGTVNLQQWYSSLGYTTSAEIASARTTMASNKVNTIEECYVTGISPTDETAKFEARIVIGADGKPVVKWSPDLNENGTKTERVYRVLGAKELGAAAQWDNVTDLQDYGAEQGYRFFKVDVELP